MSILLSPWFYYVLSFIWIYTWGNSVFYLQLPAELQATMLQVKAEVLELGSEQSTGLCVQRCENTSVNRKYKEDRA